MQIKHNSLTNLYIKILYSFLILILITVSCIGQTTKANIFQLLPPHNGLTDPSYEVLDVSFPVVRTLPSKTVDNQQISLLGVVVSNGKRDCSQIGFDYRPQGSMTWISWIKEGACTNDINYILSDISHSERYEFRAKAKNNAGWGYGSILSTSNNSFLAFDGRSVSAQYNFVDTYILPISFDPQDETYTCEAAAAKMASNYLGYPVSEGNILARTGRVGPDGDPNQTFVNGYGVHPGPMARAINMLDNGTLATEWSGDINALYQRSVAGEVTIIWMNQSFGTGYHEHAVTIMGFRNGNVLYMDPWYGQREESVDTFVSKWWGWGITISGGAHPVYRFYNISNGTHFYTASAEERDRVGRLWGTIYRYEGVVYRLTNNGLNTIQLYRFWNKNGTHFYTNSPAERDNIVRRWPNTYTYEGIAYNVAVSGSHVYRFYNISNGTHFYTASAEERDRVGRLWGTIYRYEGTAYYVQ